MIPEIPAARSELCGVELAKCVCGEPRGHVKAGQEIHRCAETEKCGGEWRGTTDIDVVTYPGGFSPAQVEAMLGIVRADEPPRG